MEEQNTFFAKNDLLDLIGDINRNRKQAVTSPQPFQSLLNSFENSSEEEQYFEMPDKEQENKLNLGM
jgi:hypothetical protein